MRPGFSLAQPLRLPSSGGKQSPLEGRPWRVRERSSEMTSASPQRGRVTGETLSPAGAPRERPGAAGAAADQAFSLALPCRQQDRDRVTAIQPLLPSMPPFRSKPLTITVPQTVTEPSPLASSICPASHPPSVPSTAARGFSCPSAPQGPDDGLCPAQALVRSMGTFRSDSRGVSGGARDGDISANSEGITATA